MENEKLNRLLDLLIESMEQSKTFVLDQAPDVVQQLVIWKRTEYTVAVCLCIMAIVTLSCLFRWNLTNIIRVYKVDQVDDEDHEPEMVARVGGQVAAAIAILMAFIVMCQYIPCTLQVWLAPKVFILEYLARLAT